MQNICKVLCNSNIFIQSNVKANIVTFSTHAFCFHHLNAAFQYTNGVCPVPTPTVDP